MFIRTRVRAWFRDRAGVRVRAKVRAIFCRPQHEWMNIQIFANFSLQTFLREYEWPEICKYTNNECLLCHFPPNMQLAPVTVHFF